MLSKEKLPPPKPDRPENSVLFSLRELRRLEDERVQAEADAFRAHEEAERRAKADAEQRTRDEATRRAREEEERRQHAERAREARQREDRLRLEEAERRTRVEGELKLRERQLLEKQRQEDLQRRRLGRSLPMPAAAVATVFLAVGGVLVALASRQHQAEKKALEQEIARQSEEGRAAELAFDRKIRALEEQAHRYLGEAKTANDQARIRGDLQRQKQAVEVARSRSARRTAPPTQSTAAPPSPAFRVPQKPLINNEPLGGLPDIKTAGF